MISPVNSVRWWPPGLHVTPILYRWPKLRIEYDEILYEAIFLMWTSVDHFSSKFWKKRCHKSLIYSTNVMIMVCTRRIKKYIKVSILMIEIPQIPLSIFFYKWRNEIYWFVWNMRCLYTILNAYNFTKLYEKFHFIDIILLKCSLLYLCKFL